jgi:hypothetical protein
MKRLTGTVLLATGLLGCVPAAHAQWTLFNRRPTHPTVVSAPAQPARVVPTPVPTPAPPLADPSQGMPAVAESSIDLAAMQTPTVTVDMSHNSGGGQGGPAVQIINSKSLLLDFEVKGVGPSGVGTVELYYTRNGQIWHKHNGPVPAQSPLPVDVSEDGLYGFTVVVNNGVGLGRTPPQPGDVPQIWVEVDTTRPEVKLINTQAGIDETSRTLTLRWTATDKNLVARPITLSYAEGPQGPWIPFATNVDNTGLYMWRMSPGMPTAVLVRVEATDRVGNVGVDQSALVAPVDLSRPQASLIKASRNGTVQPMQPATQPVLQPVSPYQH